MCADIRDGREQLLPSKGRIQMSKTNYLQAVISDLQRTAGPYRCAMCARLRVGKSFLHVCSIGRCSHVFGLLVRFHMTAGHNALRGSGPGQKPAFDNALAHVGCPDRRIDRLCITCCSPSQPFTSRRMAGAISFTPRVRLVPCSAHSWPSWPTPFL